MRTYTYIAGDWTGDADLIQEIYKWNESSHWGLSFKDAHELTNSRDTSLPCTIKRSLAERLNVSKAFVLIVGKHTAALTKGSCVFCKHYSQDPCGNDYLRGNSSFVEFECEKAKRDGLKIAVIYNQTRVDKSLCPECLRYTGTHIAGVKVDDYTKLKVPDYSAIKRTFDNIVGH